MVPVVPGLFARWQASTGTDIQIAPASTPTGEIRSQAPMYQAQHQPDVSVGIPPHAKGNIPPHAHMVFAARCCRRWQVGSRFVARACTHSLMLRALSAPGSSDEAVGQINLSNNNKRNR